MAFLTVRESIECERLVGWRTVEQMLVIFFQSVRLLLLGPLYFPRLLREFQTLKTFVKYRKCFHLSSTILTQTKILVPAVQCAVELDIMSRYLL